MAPYIFCVSFLTLLGTGFAAIQAEKQKDVEAHLLEPEDKYARILEEFGKLRDHVQKLDKEISTLKTLVQKQYVAFEAYPNAALSCPEGEKIVFNSVLTNFGGHYSTSSGEFICPVNGLYFFGVSLLTSNEQHVAPQIVINDDGYTTATAGGASWDSGTNHLIIECMAGSRVWLRSSHLTGSLVSTITPTYNDIQSSFYGFLIALSP